MKERPRPIHAPMEQFPVVDGSLAPGGIPLPRLADRAGATPFYVYDRAVMRRQVEALREALPDAISLHYAIKANPMPAVVQFLAGVVDGFDLASHGEMLVALDTGMPPSEISIAGPGKSDRELLAASAAGVIVNVESPAELERLAELAGREGYRPRVAVRVNPDFELKSSGMKMGGGPKPFGVDAEKVPALIRRAVELDLDYRGLHIFSGSQNLRPEAIVEAQQKSFELARRLQEESGESIVKLNIGGGFGIPYFPGESRLPLAPIGENLAELLDLHGDALGGAEVILELGRYIVGEAGLYVCRVVDRKVSRGQVFLVTDGGLHHHLAASGNFGQVIRKNYPVAVANRMEEEERESASVVGPLCTPLDLLADRAELPPARPGDLIAIFQSGAYGLTASPTAFLSHPRPVEMVV